MLASTCKCVRVPSIRLPTDEVVCSHCAREYYTELLRVAHAQRVQKWEDKGVVIEPKLEVIVIETPKLEYTNGRYPRMKRPDNFKILYSQTRTAEVYGVSRDIVKRWNGIKNRTRISRGIENRT